MFVCGCYGHVAMVTKISPTLRVFGILLGVYYMCAKFEIVTLKFGKVMNMNLQIIQIGRICSVRVGDMVSTEKVNVTIIYTNVSSSIV